jgi:hypothetical protein
LLVPRLRGARNRVSHLPCEVYPSDMGRVLASLVVALVFVGGCASPYKWTVRTEAAPDPFVGQRAFTVAPTDLTGLRVGEKSEGEYLSAKTTDQQASWAADKRALDAEFRATLATEAADGGILTTGEGAPFVLHPMIYSIEPGYYAGVVAGPCIVKMAVQVSGTDGKVLDEILVDTNAAAFDTHTRMTRAGVWLGKSVARYLKARTTGH